MEHCQFISHWSHYIPKKQQQQQDYGVFTNHLHYVGNAANKCSMMFTNRQKCPFRWVAFGILSLLVESFMVCRKDVTFIPVHLFLFVFRNQWRKKNERKLANPDFNWKLAVKRDIVMVSIDWTQTAGNYRVSEQFLNGTSAYNRLFSAMKLLQL